MIVTRTPFRVSLFGGGSDYPKWYRQHGGAVLGFAMNKYCYISLRELPPFFEHRHRIVYSKVETVTEIAEIQHPAVRHVLQEMPVDFGLEIHHDGDLPARSGLGSSSAFTVGLIHALHAQAGRIASKEQLAREAIRIEQDVIKEAVGSQDQVWAAYGGLNRIDFNLDGSFAVSPLVLREDRRTDLLDHCMLFFTGFSRYASEVAEKKIANLERQAENIRAMTAMVDEAQSILSSTTPLAQLGQLLHEAWRRKRELADNVSTDSIDQIYEAARAAGADGGKLLGAGGGGFLLFLVAPNKQALVRQALRNLVEVRLDIDYVGSRIVVYEPDGLSRK